MSEPLRGTLEWYAAMRPKWQAEADAQLAQWARERRESQADWQWRRAMQGSE